MEVVVRAMFNRLGWLVATEEKKNRPFSEVFETLEVVIDLSDQRLGKASVSNTARRLAELKETMESMLASGTTSFLQAQRLQAPHFR